MDRSMRPGVVAQLGKRIRDARQVLDLSVAALAERSGISRRMLTQIELGQANPSVATLDLVAAGLGTTFAALMGVDSEAPPDGVEVWSTPTGSWAILLDAIDTADVSVETWKWRIVAGDEFEGESSTPTPGHMLHVIEGEVEIVGPQGSRSIAAGGSARVGGGAGYRYRVRHAAAVFLVVALQSRGG